MSVDCGQYGPEETSLITRLIELLTEEKKVLTSWFPLPNGMLSRVGVVPPKYHFRKQRNSLEGKEWQEPSQASYCTLPLESVWLTGRG